MESLSGSWIKPQNEVNYLVGEDIDRITKVVMTDMQQDDGIPICPKCKVKMHSGGKRWRCYECGKSMKKEYPFHVGSRKGGLHNYDNPRCLYCGAPTSKQGARGVTESYHCTACKKSMLKSKMEKIIKSKENTVTLDFWKEFKEFRCQK